MERLLVLVSAGFCVSRVVGSELAIVRPFASQAEAAGLVDSFLPWITTLPCNVATAAQRAVKVDLFLVYSQNLSSSATARTKVDEVVADFQSKNQAWHPCIRNLKVLEANLSASEDIYDPANAASNPQWVTGPNNVFRFILKSFIGSSYDAFFLMEIDSVPSRANWLDQFEQEAITTEDVAIRGSRYRGDNWDFFLQELPQQLLEHVNGNAIYKPASRLLRYLNDKLQQEKGTYWDRVAYDVRMAEHVLDPNLPLVYNKASYRWDSMLVGNYANTLVNGSFDSGEFVVHNGRHNVFSELNESRVTLAVSHFSNANYSVFNQSLRTLHPFRNIIILSEFPDRADGSTDNIVTAGNGSTVTWKLALQPGHMAVCELANLVTTEFFVFSDTLHAINSPVSILMRGEKPATPRIIASSKYCTDSHLCNSTVDWMTTHGGGTPTYIYDKFDVLYNTSLFRMYCANWTTRFLPTDYDNCNTSFGPNVNDYMAFVERNVSGPITDLYHMEYRETKSWRPWMLLHTAHPVDSRTCSAFTDEYHQWSVNNITTCHNHIEQPTSCDSDTSCMWRPMFRSGKCIPFLNYRSKPLPPTPAPAPAPGVTADFFCPATKIEVLYKLNTAPVCTTSTSTATTSTATTSTATTMSTTTTTGTTMTGTTTTATATTSTVSTTTTGTTTATTTTATATTSTATTTTTDTATKTTTTTDTTTKTTTTSMTSTTTQTTSTITKTSTITTTQTTSTITTTTMTVTTTTITTTATTTTTVTTTTMTTTTTPTRCQSCANAWTTQSAVTSLALGENTTSSKAYNTPCISGTPPLLDCASRNPGAPGSQLFAAFTPWLSWGCFVCAAPQASADTDVRSGFYSGTIEFGPNQVNNKATGEATVDESVVIEYKVYWADSSGTAVGSKALATVPKQAKAVSCCSLQYTASINANFETGAVKFVVKPVIDVGLTTNFEAAVGEVSGVIVDVVPTPQPTPAPAPAPPPPVVNPAPGPAPMPVPSTPPGVVVQETRIAGNIGMTVNNPAAFVADPVAREGVKNALAQVTGAPAQYINVILSVVRRRLGDGRRLQTGAVNVDYTIAIPATASVPPGVTVTSIQNSITTVAQSPSTLATTVTQQVAAAATAANVQVPNYGIAVTSVATPTVAVITSMPTPAPAPVPFSALPPAPPSGLASAATPRARLLPLAPVALLVAAAAVGGLV